MKVDVTTAGDKKKVVFNRNIKQFSDEQQSFISETLKEYMEIFGYCSQLKDGEAEDNETS